MHEQIQQLVEGKDYQIGSKVPIQFRYWGVEGENHVFVRKHPLAESTIQVYRIQNEHLIMDSDRVVDSSHKYTHSNYHRTNSKTEFQIYSPIMEAQTQ